MKKPINKKNFAIAGLRRQSYRWPSRNEALKAGKIGRNQYICRICSSSIIHPRKNIQIDHIEPIIPVRTGWISFDSFIDRLFCDTSSLQLLCRKHHKDKTDAERKERKIYKDLAKQEGK